MPDLLAERGAPDPAVLDPAVPDSAADASPPPPLHHPNLDHRISPWLDEQMWGHRLWDAQSPWLVFLEFLAVAEATARDGRLLEAGGAYPLTYRPQQRLYLRNILFNSDDVARVAEEVPDSRAAWARWLAGMGARARAVPNRDFAYLERRFHSFAEFARVVRLLRGTVVEGQSNKRWSSRFVFPFGASAIYEDLDVKEATGTASRDYVYFGRTGELLYLMLARAARRDELVPVVARIVGTDSSRDRLVRLLQPDADAEGDRATRGRAYLPYAGHPIFDALADDWLAVERLRLPGFDAYPHWVTLGALHLLRYHLAVGVAWADRSDGGAPVGPREAPVPMVCEIVAPRKTLVRELALASYAANDALSGRAIEAYLARIERSDAWRDAAGGEGAFVRCRALLRDAVWWGDDYAGPNDPDALLRELRRHALQRHRKHVAQVHRTYGRDVGLVSRRGTNRFRYAPTDGLLKSLLLATVPDRLEFGEFLSRLYTRYGLVIGEREAEAVLPADDYDKKVFQSNARRLEERLASLGLLRRLSDACAYVQNPYAAGSPPA